MKILHINSYYASSKFYKYFYDLQERSGMDIDVFVPVPKTKNHPSDSFGPYTTLSFNHGRFDRYAFHLKHKKIVADIQVKYDISAYSLLHAHSLFSNGFVAMKLKRKYRIPYVVAVRNTDVNTFFKKMIHLRRLGVKILNEADQIVFLSKSHCREVINKYIPNENREEIIEKIKVIPNGIEKFWIDNKYLRENLNDSPLRLLFVGDVNKNKNIITTLKAVELMQEKGNCARLTVVGAIKDQSIFRELDKYHCLDYFPFMPKESLLEQYRKHDIFVMPSIHETFGLVYAEAMSQGLPVIYSIGQGFDEQFPEGQVGYHVDPHSHCDIERKIEAIVDNYLDISHRCTDLCSRFEWGAIVTEYSDVYDKIF